MLGSVRMHCKQFRFMYSHKYLGKPHSIYQLNICNQNYNIQFVIMIFNKYDSRSSYSAGSMGKTYLKRKYEITEVILWKRIMFPD